MASAKFIEEALSTDVDESAVNAIVGSLETQLVTSGPASSVQHTTALSQNHINSAISNGGPKHEGIANGESVNVAVSADSVSGANNSASNCASQLYDAAKTAVGSDGQVKLVYGQGATAVSAPAQRLSFPSHNGNITNVQSKPQAIVIKPTTCGAPGLVTMPMNTNVSQLNSAGTMSGMQPGVMTLAKQMGQTVASTQNVVVAPQSAVMPGNVQILNVRPGVPQAQQQKAAVQSRVVLSAGPQMVGARPGQPVSAQPCKTHSEPKHIS